ncbi:YndJ family protein [Streptomyces sp. NPDC086023]|uniref:YndJ family protein n=1 Tax=Streptomyces sp. NPDC086023 TaxID=3365746 RepID=UPI0037D7159F
MKLLVDPVVALGMLAVVPAGLRLAGSAGPRGTGVLTVAARWWPVAALPGAVSLWLPRGATSTALAAVYALAALALAALAGARLVRAGRGDAAGRADRAGGGARRPRPRLRLRPRLPAEEVALLTALVSPSVAATALVAERAGRHLFGFDLDILALTVPHFHFAGFTAALVAGLVCRAAGAGPRARFAAYSVPAGTLLVLAGYFVDDWLELAGALVLTAGMWTVSLLTWQDIRGRTADRLTRALLATSAVVLPATMLLALSWALGEATGLPHLSLTWTAATHGLGNALGFALCSVLAWHRLKETPA